VLDPQDGRLAFVPNDVPATVQAMVVAGNELQGLPYGAPLVIPTRGGAAEEDCSSTVNYVLYRSGGTTDRGKSSATTPWRGTTSAGERPGPGRWVTIYATTRPSEHVFLIVAGVEAGHQSTTGPTLARIGTKTALGGGFSVTYPLGPPGRSATRPGCRLR